MISNLLLQRFLKCSTLQICHRSIRTVPYFSSPSIECPHLLKTQCPVSTQVRSFWESFPYVRPLFYEKDGLDRKNYEMIYRANTFNYAFYAQLTSMAVLAGQCIGVSYYGFKSYMTNEVVLPTVVNAPFSIYYDMVTVLILGIFTAYNAVLYIAAQTVLLRAYYCEENDNYVFITLGKNPFKSHRIFCKSGDMISLKHKWYDFIFGNHVLKGRRLFLKNSNFKTMYHYNQLVGY